MTQKRTAPPEGPFRYRRPIEVRFGDTDALGHVNNAVYLTYFEAARAGYYADVTGTSLDFLADGARAGIGFILAEARVSFVSPARFGERLEIEARVGWVSRSSFGMTYRITAPERDGAASGRDRGRATRLGDPALISYGETVQVMFDYASGKVRPIPTDLIGRLEAYEGRRFRALSRD